MKTRSTKRLVLISYLFITILVTAARLAYANQDPLVTAVSGQSDWSILPPQIPSEYVTFSPDGITIKEMPLKGNFFISGEGIEFEGFMSGRLNADVDLAGTGTMFGPLTVTEQIKGKEKVVFQGAFIGSLTGLRASGQILLEGRGHYAGSNITVSFLETDPNSEVFTMNGFVSDRKGEKP